MISIKLSIGADVSLELFRLSTDYSDKIDKVKTFLFHHEVACIYAIYRTFGVGILLPGQE